MRRIRTLLVCAVWLLCSAVQAQWQWVDKNGHKVFSDQPPPYDIPVKSILKRPGVVGVFPAAAAAPPTTAAPALGASATATAAAVPRLSEDDKELLDAKKKAEAQAKAKVKAEADRLAQVKATNCEKARANQALMDSGVRVSITNAKGEREILDDAARAAEQKKIRTVIETNCK